MNSVGVVFHFPCVWQRKAAGRNYFCLLFINFGFGDSEIVRCISENAMQTVITLKSRIFIETVVELMHQLRLSLIITGLWLFRQFSFLDIQDLTLSPAIDVLDGE